MKKWFMVSVGIVSSLTLFFVSCFFIYWGIWNILYNRGPDGVGFALGAIPLGVLGIIFGAMIVRKLWHFLRPRRHSTQAESTSPKKGETAHLLVKKTKLKATVFYALLIIPIFLVRTANAMNMVFSNL